VVTTTVDGTSVTSNVAAVPTPVDDACATLSTFPAIEMYAPGLAVLMVKETATFVRTAVDVVGARLVPAKVTTGAAVQPVPGWLSRLKTEQG